MTVHIHFAEHCELPVDGISAMTDASKPHLLTTAFFSNEGEFRKACSKIDEAIANKPDDVHMIVISTHGTEGTGTWFDMGTKNKPFPVLEKLFAPLPARTLIFLSVCWGGYTANVSRLQACGGSGRPAIVGALVSLFNTEADQLQDAVLDTLLKHGVDDARLVDVVGAFNASLRADYDQDPARIATTTGELIPKAGTAGIAWSLLERPDGSVADGPFVVEEVDGNRAKISGEGKVWSVAIGRLRLAKKDVKAGDRFQFKAKKHPDEDVLSIVGTPRLA